MAGKPRRRMIALGVTIVVTAVVIGALVFWWQQRADRRPPLVVQAQPPVEQAMPPPDVDLSLPALELARLARQQASQQQWASAIATGRVALAKLGGDYGANHLYVAYVADDLAVWSIQTGALAQARDYSAQAVGIAAEQLADDDARLAGLRNTQATVWLLTGEIPRAKAAFEQIVATYSAAKAPVDNTLLARARRQLASAELELGEFAAAAEHYRQALASLAPDGKYDTPLRREYALGAVKALLRAGDGAEAEKVAQRLSVSTTDDLYSGFAGVALAKYRGQLLGAEGRVKALLDQGGGRSSLDRAALLSELGHIYILKGQLVEAEPVYRELLGLQRQQLGSGHPAVGRSLHSLAIVYKNLGLVDQSKVFYEHALAIFRGALGEGSPAQAATQLEYSLLLVQLEQFDAARHMAEGAVARLSRAGDDHSLQQGYALSALGTVELAAGNPAQAVAPLEQARQKMLLARGEQAADLPPLLMQLAKARLQLGELPAAADSIREAVAMYRAQQANTPFALASALSLQSRIHAAAGRGEAALADADRVLTIMRERLGQYNGRLQDAVRDEQRQSRQLFEHYLDVVYPQYQARINASNNESTVLADQLAQAAQYPIASATAAAVSRMAARFAVKDNELGHWIRDREALLARIEEAEGQALRVLGGMEGGFGAHQPIDVEVLKKSLRRLEQKLQQQYPDYSQLTDPRPMAVASVQSVLRDGEGVFFHLTSPRASYLFLITPSEVHIAQTTLTRAEATQQVEAIRRSVDLSKVKRLSDLPAFAVDESYALYQGLLAPFARPLKAIRHLVMVPDGPLQNINPALLLPEAPPKNPVLADYHQLPFLGRAVAISVAPSVDAFVYLRNLHPHVAPEKGLLGFGDPDLDRDTGANRGGPALNNTTREWRSVLGSLPETRQELEAIARLMNDQQPALYFRDEATETRVKHMALDAFRVVAFATHGLVSGEFFGLTEPALVLTPPDHATDEDDGLLTSGEIAELNFNADWIVLSACNTAAPEGRPGAEGLSGLAKSFFYAGSRSLLASHWTVGSDAAARLTTASFKALRDDPGIGRAEALRRAMVVLINDRKQSYLAHPAFWAPFVLVGEGGTVARGKTQ